MLRLIDSEYSTHIRGNVRVYQSEAGDYKVDWRFPMRVRLSRVPTRTRR